MRGLITATAILLLTVSAQAQTPNAANAATLQPPISTPAIKPDSQQTLSAAYIRWTQAQQAAEQARLEFSAVMYKAMAEAKVSPDEYQLAFDKDKGLFVFNKVEVKNAQASPPVSPPATATAKP